MGQIDVYSHTYNILKILNGIINMSDIRTGLKPNMHMHTDVEDTFNSLQQTSSVQYIRGLIQAAIFHCLNVFVAMQLLSTKIHTTPVL